MGRMDKAVDMAEKQRQRDAHNAQLREARLKAAAEEKAARDKARNEARAEAAETGLREHLRAQYMNNPAATETDFNNAYPKLREAHLHREAIEAPDRAKQAQAATIKYTAM